VVAYWLSVLATALRQRQTLFPSFLLLDGPRKSIGAQDDLADTLYRQVETLAQAYGTRVQIIVSDSSVPTRIAKLYQHWQFSYTDPVVATIPHPGPAHVKTVEEIQIEERPS
jgi:hypothetical protein